MKRVVIEVIPHNEQRYDTLGDWQVKEGEVVIKVSDVGNWLYSWLVAVHELVEVMLCLKDGVRQVDVDRFDIEYEKQGQATGLAPCGCRYTGEPGSDKHAPYHEQHKVAEAVERLILRRLGISWREYNKVLDKVYEED